MLNKQTVSDSLLEVLEGLMKEDSLKEFVLVGGTALALKYGHRNSVDIDMFSGTTKPIGIWNILKHKPNRKLLYEGEYSLNFLENDVKVDIANWNMNFKNIEYIENIRMANSLDIFAMKFEAITSRQVKKDFFDIDELLNHFSFEEGYNAFNKTFPFSKNQKLILQAIGEIDKADDSPTPILLNNQDWEYTKFKLRQLTKQHFFGKLKNL